MFDLIVRNGLVVDGTGLPRRRVDVGVQDGKVARLGHLDGHDTAEEIDASGMVVAPGIVDVHTHYDPQITFDPYATVSCFHGVTTVLAGNCGFSVAPVPPADREFIEGIFAAVENMDPIALSGVRWAATFPELMDRLHGHLGVNFACYVGHSNVRRLVMGDDAVTRAATRPEIDAMRALVADAMEAGAAGVSSSAAPTHLDTAGRPVPSRFAEHEELLALAEEVGRYGAGSVAFLPFSAIGGITPDDEDYLIALAKASGLPVIIQGLGGRNKVDAPTATWDAALDFLDRATGQGAPVYSMLISRPFDRRITIGPGNLHYLSVESWTRMFDLSHDEIVALLRDDAARDELRTAVEQYNRDPSKGTTNPPPRWRDVYVDHATLEEHRHLEGLSIEEIAAKEDRPPADVMLDLALAEDLGTEFRWRTENPEWADAVRTAQLDSRMVIGISDGGAHLARDDGADWSSYFLRNWVLDRGVWSLEEGIRQITQVPAALVGLPDRGTLQVGKWADMMVFDPATIGPWKKEFVRDLPGNVGRFKAWGQGVKATIVNGQPIVLDGALTGRLPGHVVRPS
jgi:N-acyl-D-aspartate/D-glutamate deacylase